VRTRALFAIVQGALLAVVAAWAVVADPEGPRLALPVLLLGFQACLYLSGVCELLPKPEPRPLLLACVTALLPGIVLALFADVLLAERELIAPAAVALGLLSALAVGAIRILFPRIARHRQLLEGHLILGGGEQAIELREELGSERVDSARPMEAVVSLGYGNLRGWAHRHGYSRIVVADLPDGDVCELAASLIECKASGMRVEQAVDSYGRLRGKLWLDGVRTEWLVYAPAFSASPFFLFLKRSTDIAGSALLLLLSLPLFAVLALAIKLDSSGPVLIRQERVGLNGRRFLMAKLRSMRVDAESESGPTWCREGDPRITRFGRLLRKFRLDELPQVVNVLKGEMSFVGPRPERPAFVDMLAVSIPYYQLRHSVRPGITGWAQVMYPYGASLRDAREKLEYDLYYLQNLSIAFDARILVRTLRVVLSGGGR
jgi:exopolysaccharide biosynthesis polyprenyl glycosylphosphotransferase